MLLQNEYLRHILQNNRIRTLYTKGHCKIAFNVCDICLYHIIFYVHIFIDDLMIPNDACM